MTRIAVIDKDKIKDKKEWFRLISGVCPVNRSGVECVYMTDDGDIGIDEETCIGCGICVKKCPYHAVQVINLPEELTEKPIHRYGDNGFSLYNLPVPIFGKVVGVLGKNGIGKSTAIKVLAGVLDPNLGETSEENVDFEKLLEFFKGTEAQIFFEKVRDKKIKISYKPQQVDLIPKTTKGKVKALLKKVDEKKQFDKIVKELQLEEILDNDITKISGGELQRVAIAATVLKKANLYIFDEPTSYLDIKQRLRVSKFIKNLANDNTAVLVVEHDLIILDYMTELVHMMYGSENVYGIVSLPKSTKAGINIYLSGFLKEENVRFRDSKIKFEVRPPIKKREGTTLTSWGGVKKKLGKFSLEAEKGEVLKREVVGILGENGIGKTSFVKILAGVDEQDEGKITEKIKVSYKPQYLESDSSEMVVNVVRRAIQKYTNQLINPLNIKPLFMKKLNELSGGELQRVSVALCLSQEADLYLLDEPSAYLDVEQRLIVSKIIGDFMEQKSATAMIVDHDLLFIDYISQNLIVFEGKPAIEGRVDGPFMMEEGMNIFLKGVGITFRRDNESHRPRANKVGSVKDREQKDKGKLYYG